MGNIVPKQRDGTAQGIAKVRHYEALLPDEKRLFFDPFAYAMYPGSVVQKWMGPSTINKLYSWMGIGGFQEIITIRTKWIDSGILESDGMKQLIILGAGYDTRGFRLDLADDVVTLEVDQPDVQKEKIAKLDWLSSNGHADVGEKKKTGTVQFVPVNFNSDSLDDQLLSHEGFQSNKSSVVVMEGVTQYIPKESTADSLTKLKGLLPKGSILLITYVDQNMFDDPSQVGPENVSKLIMNLAKSVGEPWISGFTKEEFAALLKECGYEVVSNTTASDYNEKYLEPVGRKVKEGSMPSMERFVKARLL